MAYNVIRKRSVPTSFTWVTAFIALTYAGIDLEPSPGINLWLFPQNWPTLRYVTRCTLIDLWPLSGHYQSRSFQRSRLFLEDIPGQGPSWRVHSWSQSTTCTSWYSHHVPRIAVTLFLWHHGHRSCLFQEKNRNTNMIDFTTIAIFLIVFILGLWFMSKRQAYNLPPGK